MGKNIKAEAGATDGSVETARMASGAAQEHRQPEGHAVSDARVVGSAPIRPWRFAGVVNEIASS